MTGGTETETRMETLESWIGIEDIARIGVEIEIGAEIVINITETKAETGVTEDEVRAEKGIVTVIKDIMIIGNLL